MDWKRLNKLVIRAKSDDKDLKDKAILLINQMIDGSSITLEGLLARKEKPDYPIDVPVVLPTFNHLKVRTVNEYTVEWDELIKEHGKDYVTSIMEYCCKKGNKKFKDMYISIHRQWLVKKSISAKQIKAILIGFKNIKN